MKINTLGDFDSRKIYRDALISYFSDYKSKLSEDILKMYENNMMIPSDVLDIAFKMRAFVIVKPRRAPAAHCNYYLKAYKKNKSYDVCIYAACQAFKL